jgi:hypothetical protein
MRRPASLPLAPLGLVLLLAASLPLAACAQRIRPVPIAPLDSLAFDRSALAALDSAGGGVGLEGDDADAALRSATAPRTRADSIAWRETRASAERDTAYRVVVPLEERRLRVLAGSDTLFDAPAGIGKPERLEYAGREWTFETPRGRRRVLAKEANPVWVPPDWHYAEVARDFGFRLAWLPRNRPVRLRDGSRLEVRGRQVGIVRPGETFAALPVDEEIVFDSTLYVPPTGTLNRRIVGELGEYRIDLGSGYLLHGTPHTTSIGEASTHGCVRLADADIGWLYDNVPLGTRVYIY